MTEIQKLSKSAQHGGFAVGLIVGLLIGLALALGVALYVTKVPVPFVNKVPQRTAGQDAAEAEKNKNWDPNSPLYGKNPARPSAVASGAVTAPPAVVTAPTAAPTAAPTTAPATVPTAAATRASAAQSTRDPAAILADRPASAPAPKVAKAEATPAPAPAPAASGPDPFMYFVQAGAYSRTEEADQQKARLAMLGMEGRVSEREQAGRTVYRVRLGPFSQKADADAAKDKLAASGVETQLVRVQR